MYIYNVSIQLESGIESDWLSWMSDKHLAEVMASGCFTAYNIFQLIEPTEDGVCTYIVQYQADFILTILIGNRILLTSTGINIETIFHVILLESNN